MTTPPTLASRWLDARLLTFAAFFASMLVSLAACSSDSAGGGGSSGGDGGRANEGDGGAASRDGGASGAGIDASSGGSGNICQQAATKLTSCGLSTGGIENDCNTRNACYAACMVAATCPELQGSLTDDNSYTQCLSGC